MRYSSLVALIFLFSLRTIANPSLLDSARIAYDEGRYKRAVTLYRSLINDGYSNAELYYNLGNAYAKEGRIGLSILNFEKALWLKPGLEEAQFNLDIQNAKIKDEFEEIPSFGISEFNMWLYENVSAGFWLWMSLFLIVISSVWLVVRKQSGKGFRWIEILPIVPILLFLFMHKQTIRSIESVKEGVVLAESINVFSAPNQNGKLLLTLHEGTKVSIKREEEGYLEITTPNGIVGWLSEEKLGIIQIKE